MLNFIVFKNNWSDILSKRHKHNIVSKVGQNINLHLNHI